ncbi:hypothetical protein [Chitinimonas lacunae]|uniref:Uncharacterized protein n=1 Tax=Chitinimonas lacunae TaxID=1963018 RepID=A0ABV8MMQ4_9NEIS
MLEATLSAETAMLSPAWQEQLRLFRKKSQLEQLVWLSCLSHRISLYARGTYEPGTDEVSQPRELRRFNELLHRLAGFQYKVARHSPEGMPAVLVFKLIEDELERLGLSHKHVLACLP